MNDSITSPQRLHPNTKAYRPEPGDEFVPVDSITAKDRERIFEARFQDGTGRLGRLRDAEHYMLNDVIIVRFEGQRVGAVAIPNDKGDYPSLLMKPAGYQMPEAATDV